MHKNEKSDNRVYDKIDWQHIFKWYVKQTDRPSVRQIKKRFGIKSTSSIMKQIDFNQWELSRQSEQAGELIKKSEQAVSIASDYDLGLKSEQKNKMRTLWTQSKVNRAELANLIVKNGLVEMKAHFDKELHKKSLNPNYEIKSVDPMRVALIAKYLKDADTVLGNIFREYEMTKDLLANQEVVVVFGKQDQEKG